ncbi:MAG: hypothetical protein U0840_10675 [Gemmataceae bacterium]
MMVTRLHHPDERNPDPDPELGELLRAAIDQVRQDSPPPRSLQRALDRALLLDEPCRLAPRWRASLLAACLALAASFLVLLHSTSTDPGHPASGDLQLASGVAGPPTLLPAPPPASPPPVLLRPGPFTLAGLRDEEPSGISMGQVGSHWGDWERIIGLETLGRPPGSPGPIRYLRYTPDGPRHDPWLAWHAGAPPLTVGRIRAGDGTELTLKGLAVQVRIEGPRARTFLDHIFHTGEAGATGAIFETALPSGASPSYFAFFPGQRASEGMPAAMVPGVPMPARLPGLPSPDEAGRRIDATCWGRPQVAQVEPLRALPEELHGGAGPAPPGQELAATVAAINFRGGLGTMPPGSMVRVLLAYEELLPLRDGAVVYQHALPEVRLPEVTVTVENDASQGGDVVVEPQGCRRTVQGERLTHRWQWKSTVPAGPVVVRAVPPSRTVQTTAGRLGAHHYLLARIQPELRRQAQLPFARKAVFLLDTSAGEQPDRFDRSIRLLTTILERDAAIEQFNVLAFNSGSFWLEPAGWLTNDRQGRAAVLARLDGLLLEGAADLGAALARLDTPTPWFAPDTPVECFLLADGQASAGERDPAVLASRAERHARGPRRWHCYQMGLGEENADLYGLLTRRGGGIYRCIDETDLPTAALAHRQVCLTIDRLAFQGGPAAHDVLVAGRRAAIPAGGTLVVAARFHAAGTTTLTLEGKLGTQTVRQTYPMQIDDRGVLAPRAWGELAVHALLGPNDARLEPLALHYARRFRVPSRISALALGDYLTAPPGDDRPHRRDLDPLVQESWQACGEEPTLAQRRAQLQEQVDGWGTTAESRQRLRELAVHLPETDLQPLEAAIAGGLTLRTAADPAYLTARREQPQELRPVLDEVDRRLHRGQSEAALRLLSGLVAEHWTGSEVARLVAARFLVLDRPALAVRLLSHQVEQYPHDPAVHRALALAWHLSHRPARAALHYEAALDLLGSRSPWLAPVREEYALLVRQMLREAPLSPVLLDYFRRRLPAIDRPRESGLAVSVTWNSAGSALAVDLLDAAARPIAAAPPGASTQRLGPRSVSWASWPGDSGSVRVKLLRAAAETPLETLALVHLVQGCGTAAEKLRIRPVLLRRQGDQAMISLADR